MMQGLEEKLRQVGEKHRSVDIPNKLNEFIEEGINRQANRNRSLIKKLIPAAAILIFAFMAMIRVYPAFADFVSQVPGLDYIVKIVSIDKGLKSAHEKGFTQKINRSDTHEGITLTIDGILLDQAGMIVFYTIENNSIYKFIAMKSAKLLNSSNNERLKVSYIIDTYPSKNKIIAGHIPFTFDEEDKIPEQMEFDFKLQAIKSSDEKEFEKHGNSQEHKILDSEWKISVQVDKTIIDNSNKEYIIDKTISVKEQRIIFEKLIMYPTSTLLKVSFDKKNSMQVFDLANLVLIDGIGNEYPVKENGVSRSGSIENGYTYYLQASSLDEMEEIYITADGIRAIEQSKLFIDVDLNEGKVINSPNDKLEFKYFGPDKYSNDGGNVLELVLDEIITYVTIFEHDIYNAQRDRVIFKSSKHGSSKLETEGKTIFTVHFDKQVKLPDIISLKLAYYPETISKNINIRVK